MSTTKSSRPGKILVCFTAETEALPSLNSGDVLAVVGDGVVQLITAGPGEERRETTCRLRHPVLGTPATKEDLVNFLSALDPGISLSPQARLNHVVENLGRRFMLQGTNGSMPIFPKTNWNLVAGASQRRESDLARIFELYRAPLVHFIMSVLKLTPEDAEDLVHEFFAERIFEKQDKNHSSFLSKADPQKGQFHKYFCRCARNFVHDKLRREDRQAEKIRQYTDELILQQQLQQIDQGQIEWRIVNDILDRCITRFRDEASRKEKYEWWLVFKFRVYDPLTTGVEPLSYATICSRTGGKLDPVTATNYLTHAKRKLQIILRDVLKDYSLDYSSETIRWIRQFCQ